PSCRVLIHLGTAFLRFARARTYSVSLLWLFFFMQKAAYEVGLGIPAEPLFRSVDDVASSAPVLQTPKATSSTLYFDSLTVNAGRSEERRVGKELRFRGMVIHLNMYLILIIL